MQHCLVLGAGGMLGRKLVASLVSMGPKLTLHDIVPPEAPPGAQALPPTCRSPVRPTSWSPHGRT